MSKYVKLDDVLNRLNETPPQELEWDKGEEALADLPTIEVSEELPKDIVEPIGKNVIMSEETYNELIEQSVSEDAKDSEIIAECVHRYGGKAVVDACKDRLSRPKGEWIEGETIYFCGEQHFPMKCSVCGRTALNEPWHFCPNCGADMKGAEE